MYAVFIGAGLGFATWASRIPQVRDILGLSPATLGLVLLTFAAGAVIALPTSGVVVHRIGTQRTVAVTALLFAAGLIGAGLGTALQSIPVVVVSLVIGGYGFGTWDVAMNVEGAEVEHQLGRSIMPRFHAAFSIGTVAGALFGAAMNALGIGVLPHFLVIGIAIALTMPWASRSFLPVTPPDAHDTEPTGSPLRAWLEPRTLLIGVFVLCMSVAEGSGNDWIGVAAIDGQGATAALATLAYAMFLIGMTGTRWWGTALLDRMGRVTTVRLSAAIGALGVVLVVVAPVIGIAMLGSLLWGMGSGMGFPVGMSAAADDPRRAAGRVSVVASIGYLAFLLGPTTIGFIGEYTGVLRALFFVAGMLALAFAISGVTRPLATNSPAQQQSQPR